uniref:Uncharacterized protein n=1 Tax=Mantoniella antarctica TaxID=81844 RepID=A0A7S0SJP2_9CHLO|eukprot:CAMPEP_0181386388 /NCGR_PEP_ID=MMETSP1106-20121128/23112_1 /TAXON_ID=81844 /ORGANISM="Mantoniella antarctica, Strain SL-175" /LENGTH=117 /DNA_ID=CAMNT_0023506603 /DNA_START=289 /DNA_END=642 /DNA_ORIENTATION=+
MACYATHIAECTQVVYTDTTTHRFILSNCARIQHQLTSSRSRHPSSHKIPICVAVQYNHTAPMPTQKAIGRALNARNAPGPTPSSTTPSSFALRAALDPRYKAADVESNSGRSNGPP